MSEEDRGIILRRDGQQFGPYTREETVRYLNNGSLFLGETLAPQDFAGLGLIALGLAAIDGRALSLLRERRLQPTA